MDIRNFFGPPKITKHSKETKKEEESKTAGKTSNTNKRKPKLEKQTSKEKAEVSRTRSGKTPQKSKKNDDKKVIKIDSDEDENKNVSQKKNTRDKRKSRDLFADSDEDSSPQKPSKKSKKKISSDDDDLEEEVKPKNKKSKTNKKTHRIIESDDEEEPIPKSDKKKKSSKKSAPVYIDDSDEEKRKKSTLDSFLKTPSPQKTKPKTGVKKEDSAVKKTPISAMDFFGGGSVKRTEKSMVSSKRKLEEANTKEDEFDDVEMHDDEDFVKTLESLDEGRPAKKARVVSPEKKVPEEKPKESLASKLAAKSKNPIGGTPEKSGTDVLVPETPISQMKSPKKEPGTQPQKKSPVKPEKSPAKPEKVSPKRPSPSASDKASTATPGSKTSPKKASPDTPATLERKGTTYRSYLTREGPQALGSKEIPEGAPNCLEGLTFVITGVLESMERDEAKSLVEKYGGKVTTSISKKTSYMVVGRDAGESKLNKAKGFGTKQIDEDGLLELIRTKPGKKSKYEIQAEESIRKEQKESLKKEGSTPSVTSKQLSKFERTPSPKKLFKSNSSQSESSMDTGEPSSSKSESSAKNTDQSGSSEMWVDKYKPSAMKSIIGQQGDKSNAKKLLNWINNWHKNRAAGIKPSGKFFGKDETGAGFKAALLSGPPGIGKTTTATLVCKEAGFSFVELNASDTRSKKTLQSVVAESLNNTTMVDFAGGQRSKTGGHKHCMVMDEVDGMAGNEDRGGIQELVGLIKSTKIPIICMCNDRNHPKMRTLSNYCFDLRFQRPRVEQIKAAMMSIAFKEGVKIPPPALNEIIVASNQDIRQVIHNLSMWSASNKTMTYEQTKKDAEMAKKDMQIGPFEVTRKVFAGGQETASMTINDKSDLFFQDYSFGPLFVQENYIHVTPYSAKGHVGRHLSQLARAADSISDGDMVDKLVRGGGHWGLLPVQAIYASVMPGEHMRGGMSQMIQFPQWLGKNSSTGKHDRILQELQTHMRLHVSCDKRSLNMDYLPYLRRSLTDPLVKHDTEGVSDVIKLMNEYDIIKDDFDNILEVSKWSNSKDPMASVAPKTKAAFTRTYNKESHMTPYSTGVVTKKKKGGAAMATDDDGYNEEGGEAPSSEEDDNVDLDTMIKIKKKENKDNAKKKAAEKRMESAKSSKGKGRGKGKS